MAARERLALGVIAARERLNIGKEQFAKKAGASIKTIQRIELRRVTPTIKTFNKIDKGAGWAKGDARRLYEEGREPTLEDGRDSRKWTPMLSDEQIIAMDSRSLADHYIRIESEFGSAAAEDWLFHAMVVRRDARRAAGRTLAADGS